MVILIFAVFFSSKGPSRQVYTITHDFLRFPQRGLAPQYFVAASFQTRPDPPLLQHRPELHTRAYPAKRDLPLHEHISRFSLIRSSIVFSTSSYCFNVNRILQCPIAICTSYNIPV
jgi:hypothetical protein